MKKFLLIISACVATVVHSQAIDRNDIVITSAGGMCGNIYAITDSTGFEYREDATLGINLHLRAEYAFSRTLGMSLNFAYTDLVSEEIGENDKSMILDFGAAINYHFPWALRRFDLTGFAGLGYSIFSLKTKESIHEEYNASGIVAIAGINPRFYFTDAQHLGIGLSYHYSYYTYPNATYKTDLDPEYVFSFRGMGHAFGIGLFYKI